MLEAEKLTCEKKKIELHHLNKRAVTPVKNQPKSVLSTVNDNQTALNITDLQKDNGLFNEDRLKKRRRSVSVKRFRVEKDGTKTLISTEPL